MKSRTNDNITLNVVITLRNQFKLHFVLYINYDYILDNDCCTLQCCGPSRPFELRILDNTQKEVIHLSRPYRCSACCCPCCLQELVVEAPVGNVIGYVRQT